MDIVCPSCEAAYEIDGASVSASGRKVRCAACATIWRVFPVGYDPVTGLLLAEADYTPPTPAQEVGAADAPEESAAEAAAPAQSEPEPSEEQAGMAVAVDAGAQGATALHEASAGKPDDAAGGPVSQKSKWLKGGLSAAGKKATRFGGGLPAPSWQAGVMAATVALVATGLHQRERVVRFVPQTARLYAAIGMPVNLRGIIIRDVASRLIEDNGVSVLVVDGGLVNPSSHKIDVPRLRFAVLGPDGQEVYAWSAQADRTVLQPGEKLNFRRRLAAPPSDGKEVSVRFVTRSDITSGIR